MSTDLEESEDSSSVVGDHFQQRVKVSTVRCLTVRSTERERQEV